ncbi:MAG: poly(A) polymerase, partial [Cyanophyceae cyanobacterium]
LRPSQVMTLCDPVGIPMLILLAAELGAEGRRVVYRYLTQWKQLKPLLNGHDLRAMGYPPSPFFQEILSQVKKAALDGQLTTAAQACDWVTAEFPLAHD